MKTRITREGTIHYLECVDCGEPKTTRFQKQKERCKPCAHKKRFEHLQDKEEGLRECKVCEETKPSTNEFFHYKDKKTGRLDRTCKVCDNNRKNNWNKANPEKKKQQGRKTYHKNKDKVLSKQKEKRAKDPSVREYYREYYNVKQKNDPAYKVKRSVTRRVHEVITGQKNGQPTFDKLPYTQEQLKEHLENQFDSKMTWENYGTYWHVDHIYPQSLLPYDSMEHPNFQKCWALDNLRPLEAKANMSKGNKVD